MGLKLMETDGANKQGVINAQIDTILRNIYDKKPFDLQERYYECTASDSSASLEALSLSFSLLSVVTTVLMLLLTFLTAMPGVLSLEMVTITLGKSKALPRSLRTICFV